MSSAAPVILNSSYPEDTLAGKNLKINFDEEVKSQVSLVRPRALKIGEQY